jgi:hypothetical protein
MSNFEFNPSSDKTLADLDSDASLEIKKLLASLQHSHQMRSKMINLETCALAETMDDFLPGFWSRVFFFKRTYVGTNFVQIGFWSRFLENRRTSLRQFLRQKRANQAITDTATDDLEASDLDYESNPLS